MQPTATFAPLQLDFVDPMQWRDEVIRPLVLCADRTATQRAVGRWIARFETEHITGRMDHTRGPQWPRQVWFPVMVAVYHL